MLTDREAYKKLAAHFEQVKKVHLRELFAADKRRGDRQGVAVGSALNEKWYGRKRECTLFGL